MKTENIGLLVLRVGMGFSMLFGHGLDKLSNFSQKSAMFPSVFGLSPSVSLGMAVFTEFFCALFVILGLFTKWSAWLIAATMAVAVFLIHAGDPFANRELGLLYLIGFTAVALLGPGAFSLEAKRKSGW